jgi:hypothetical protein
MQGESTKFLFPIPCGDTNPAAIAKSGRGGFRIGAGRKPKPKPCVSRAELLKLVHEISSPAAITALFIEAATGDIHALRELWALYWRAEKIGLENAKRETNGARRLEPGEA